MSTLKFDQAAKAYLAASNDLMEEVEDRGHAAASAKEVWDALNSEWAARQAVIDAGDTGNYAEVVHAYRVIAISCAVSLAIGSIGYSAYKVYMAKVERDEAKRREARRLHRKVARFGAQAI